MTTGSKNANFPIGLVVYIFVLAAHAAFRRKNMFVKHVIVVVIIMCCCFLLHIMYRYRVGRYPLRGRGILLPVAGHIAGCCGQFVRSTTRTEREQSGLQHYTPRYIPFSDKH